MYPGFGGCGTVEKASPECREAAFSEVGLPIYGVLRSSRLTSSDGIIGGALSDSLEKAGRKRRRVNATSTPQRHGSVLRGGWPRRVALPDHAWRLGVRSHLPAPLARPFGRRSAPRLLRPSWPRSFGLTAFRDDHLRAALRRCRRLARASGLREGRRFGLLFRRVYRPGVRLALPRASITTVVNSRTVWHHALFDDQGGDDGADGGPEDGEIVE